MNQLSYIIIVFLFPTFMFCQSVEVVGKVKIAIMENDISVDSLVVVRSGGELARRHVSSLLPANPSLGDLMYYNGAEWLLLAPGTDGQYLGLNSGVPSWTDITCDLSLGQFYKGGYIFYLDTTGCHGLVAAPVDQSTDSQWGCDDILISGTNAAIGTGQANTTAIVTGCTTPGIAARLCDDLDYGGYDDWFLPSKDELNLMWENLADLDGDGGTSGSSDPNNIGDFSSDFYWCSTEFNVNLAWKQRFFDGSPNFSSKENQSNVHVRAIRVF